MNLRIGSICSGIGGLELGLEWAGVGHTVWQCEVDAFCRRILAKHWPDAVRFGDVRRLSRLPVAGELFPDYPPDCDLICAGFPCQDISVAGNGAGLDGARSGLWFEVLRVIGELMPAWVVLENVDRIRLKGLDRVLEGLASLGFDAEWHRFAAADVGAPHRRRRWFLIGWRPTVADAAGLGCEGADMCAASRGQGLRLADGCAAANIPDPDSGRRAGLWVPQRDDQQGPLGRVADGRAARGRWQGQTRSTPGRWLAEPDVGRLAHGLPGQVARLKALGNAVVPQNAEVVGWRLRAIHARLRLERDAA